MKKKLRNVPYILIVLTFVWLIWSVFDVNAHNSVIKKDGDCSKFNAYNCVQPKRKSKATADYEQQKGEIIRSENEKVDIDQMDWYILAHLIYGESGADWCTDEMQLCVGSVVLNRVKSDKFPNSIREVVFQDGQYSCTWDGNYYLDANDRAYRNAKYLLINGSQLPDCVIGQAEFIYPGLKEYCKVQNMYFSYIPE